MELLKRYIAAVQRHLPDNKKQEIGRELEANIMDQLDAVAEHEPLTDATIATVLKKMGHPKQVAMEFVPPKPLISVDYLPAYKYTLYIVLGILFVLQIINTTINWLHADFGLVLYLKSILSGLIKDGSFAFTVITITFILMSAQATKTGCQREEDWEPQKLPATGPGWKHISLQDIFTDLATYAFLLIVIWYPQIFSAQQSSLLTESAQQLLIWASPLIIAGVALTIWQLKERWWNQQMQVVNIVLNSAFVIVILYLAASGPLFETDGLSRIVDSRLESIQSGITVTLLIIACFPAYEVIRDIRRLYQTRH